MESLRAARPLKVGNVTLVPIERIGIRSDIDDAGCWISAVKEVAAVVVRDSGGVRALAMDSSEIALDGLLRETPDLGVILSGLSVS